MILKPADSKEPQLHELQRLLTIAPAETKGKIEQEIRILKAGQKGESEAAYLIDFDLKDSERTAVIHDLRLELNGRVAQIDHLLIHRTMKFFALETKHFHAGIKIEEDGQFLQWNSFKKTFEGMPSPLEQNERHIRVLKDLVTEIEWPTRMGLKLLPTFESFVLVSGKSRVDRPKKFDTSRVIKVEQLGNAFNKVMESMGVLDTFGALAKIVSAETLVEVGQAIIAKHRPIQIDYAAKFGLKDVVAPSVAPSQAESSVQTFTAQCRKCGDNQKLSIQYGKYGYYFKCIACDGNTPIKLGCGKEGHKERLRKEGQRFYRECSDCGSSTLYFTNPG